MLQDQRSLVNLAVRLWRHLSPRRHKQFAVLVILMFVASFAEVISIGAVIPFLTILTAPENVFSHPAAAPFVQFFGFSGPQQLVLPLTALFAVAAIISGALRILLIWANTRLAFASGADLSINIYRRTLYQPYSVHVSRNSSELVTAILSKVSLTINSMIMPTVTIISSMLILLGILSALLMVSSVTAIVSMAGFASVYLIIVRITRRRLLLNGKLIAAESTRVTKALQEGLGDIRDVLLDGTQEFYAQTYRQSDIPMRYAQGTNQFISLSPRYAMEAIGMILIAVLAYFLFYNAGGMANAIPILGALALGAQRILPVLQQTFVAWSQIQGGQGSLEDTLNLLEQPLPDFLSTEHAPLPFVNEIRLNNLSFRYTPESKYVLKNIDLKIKKGSCVGFVGETGSGKSTLIDIVMGLLSPSEGGLIVDAAIVNEANQRCWQMHIAHVPQFIFLADTSIEENIALGTPKQMIDRKRVQEAAQRAQIAGVIEELPESYNTLVGERGVKLSGGQRQRLGIARALYKQSDILILDEATSALDDDTESKVMREIASRYGDLTILIVAHRVTTLRNCDSIVELESGKVKRIGSFSEVINVA